MSLIRIISLFDMIDRVASVSRRVSCFSAPRLPARQSIKCRGSSWNALPGHVMDLLSGPPLAIDMGLARLDLIRSLGVIPAMCFSDACQKEVSASRIEPHPGFGPESPSTG